MVSSACCEPTSEASTGLTGEPFSDSVEILKISSRRCRTWPKRRTAHPHAQNSAECRTGLGDVRQGGSECDRVHSRGTALKGRRQGVPAVTRGELLVPTANGAAQYLRGWIVLLELRPSDSQDTDSIPSLLESEVRLIPPYERGDVVLNDVDLADDLLFFTGLQST